MSDIAKWFNRRPTKEILQHEAGLQHRRDRQKDSARAFLLSGENVEGQQPPSYGGDWDRTYHPEPYPEALPGSGTLPIEHYVGTGVGYLYGLEQTEQFAHETAGWSFPFNVEKDPVREKKKEGEGYRTVQMPRLKIKSESRTNRR